MTPILRERVARLAGVVLLGVLAVTLPASAAVDAKRLSAVKAATAFVRVTTHSGPASGTGFVARTAGGRALVVTNAHVVRHAAANGVEVVLHSGTRRERVLPAEVLVEDRASDLAVLEIVGTSLPAPVSLAGSDDVAETFELYIVGFPFGKAFATNRETPTITVGRGTVSSLRLDRNDQTKLLQIDGDVNPGNSGGPVISEDGAVIGIAVATVNDTNIGFAIPVRKLNELLDGLVGNLRVLQASDHLQLIGDWLDPLARPLVGHVLFGAEDKIRQHDPDVAGRWSPIEGEVREVPLKIMSDGRVLAAIPAAPGAAQALVAQVVVRRDGEARYQAPVQITSGEIEAVLEGPNVLPEDAPRERLGDLERGDDERGDVELVESLIATSGLGELIDRISEDRELFFRSREETAPAASDDKQDVTERLIEILGRSWDQRRLHRHYVDTFLADFERENARSVTELMKLPAVQQMHIDFIALTTQGKEGLAPVVEATRRRNKAMSKRLNLVGDLDRARGLTDSLLAMSRISRLAIQRVINELQPPGRQMAEDRLDRDVAAAVQGERARLAVGVRVLLAQFYRERSDEEIKEYIELAGTDAFRWFAEREAEAFSSMMTLRFAAAESELRGVLREAQMDALGVAEVEVSEDMPPEEIVASVLEAYGTASVVKYLISKGDGQVTMDLGGVRQLTYGRPREDTVNPGTILADLERNGIALDDFLVDLEDQAVAAGTRTRELRTTRLIKVPRSTGRSSSKRRRSSRSQRDVPACQSQCREREVTCKRYSTSSSETCYQTMRDCLQRCQN